MSYLEKHTQNKYIRSPKKNKEIAKVVANILQSDMIYIMFSGGVDSTAHLIWLAKLCKKYNKPLRTLEFSMSLNCTDVEKEKRNIIRERVNREILKLEDPLIIDISHMNMESPDEPVKTQSVYLLSVAYPFIVSKSVVFFGYHTGPEIELAWQKTQTMVDTLNDCFAKKVLIEAPHISQPKSKNYAYLLRHGYLEMTSYCLHPNENGKPCMKCTSCYDHELSKIQYEFTKSWYKANLNAKSKYVY
jgi:7-cyano-7-deazaguanine synthase in queuosine biosynthesis